MKQLRRLRYFLPIFLGIWLILGLSVQPLYANGDFHSAKVKDISDRAYEAAVIELLDGAEESIVISMYDITLGKSKRNPVQLLLNDLLEALQRDVAVTIYLNTGFHENVKTPRKLFKNAYLKKLEAAGCVIHSMPSSPRLHDKLIIVDSRYAVEGSPNWSISALKSNFESSTLIDSPGLAEVKLSRLKSMPITPKEKKPYKAQYLEDLPETIEIPGTLIKDKKYFPQMVTRHDNRSIDLYLLLLGHSQATGKKEFFINMGDMALSLGMPDSWKTPALRRQVIKSLKKLDKRYSLIHVNFSHTRDAWVELTDIPGETLSISPHIILKSDTKPSLRLKFLLLIEALLESNNEDINSIPKKELARRFHIHYWTINEAFKERSTLCRMEDF